MSQWHRAHPELTGTDADPWMAHEDYRRIVAGPREDARRSDGEFASDCPDCDRYRAALESLVESCADWSNDDVRDHCRAALKR